MHGGVSAFSTLTSIDGGRRPRLMVMSIDGATQGVYERFRRNGDLALVLANAKN